MATRYAHTNIVARDWERLADFYCQVFGCAQVPPPRDQSGAWLERGTGVPDAHLRGVHLRLPGWGEDGPTLEIYQYDQMEARPVPAANRQGIGHIAFQVDDVDAALAAVIDRGGASLGKTSETVVSGVGRIRFVYATDPEGNILELQCWLQRADE